MAFMGSTGLGKTELEKQLRRAIFTRADQDGHGSGTLVVSGADYRENNTLAALQDNLRTQVVDQVRKCPHSIIVIDEIQFVADDVLDAMVDMLGYNQPVLTKKYGAVDFRRAIFIFTTMDGGGLVQAQVCGVDACCQDVGIEHDPAGPGWGGAGAVLTTARTWRADGTGLK
jgi:ATP-dependent Clp protease ATP-binding subunit ClpA